MPAYSGPGSPYNRYGAGLANMAPSYNPTAYGAPEGTPPLSAPLPPPDGTPYWNGVTMVSQGVNSAPMGGGVYSPPPPPDVPLSDMPPPVLGPTETFGPVGSPDQPQMTIGPTDYPMGGVGPDKPIPTFAPSGPVGSPDAPQMTYPPQTFPYAGDSHGLVIPGGNPVPGGPHPGVPPPLPPIAPATGAPLGGFAPQDDPQFPPLSGSTALAARGGGQNRYGQFLGDRQASMRNYLNPTFGQGR